MGRYETYPNQDPTPAYGRLAAVGLDGQGCPALFRHFLDVRGWPAGGLTAKSSGAGEVTGTKVCLRSVGDPDQLERGRWLIQVTRLPATFGYAAALPKGTGMGGACFLGGFDLFEEDSQGLDEAQLTQQSLVDTQERMGTVLEALPVGLLIHTEQGIIYSNRRATELLQASAPSLGGQHLLDHVAPEDADAVQAAFRKAFARDAGTLTAEGAIDRPDGSRRVAHIIFGLLPWAGNPVLQIILQDVTDQKHAEASLRQLTITDELTGAYNRRHAFYEAGLYIDQAEATAPPFSVVMVDIDHFKTINDTFGHGGGDAALIGVARLFHGLLPSFRDSDSAMFARVGGEEFVVLLPGVKKGRAAEIAERLRSAVASLKVETPAGVIRLTASMGVATYETRDGGFDGLLSRADEALYAAKARGRNRVVAAP